MTSVAPLRILCLHGYMQNGQVLRRKTGVLRKKVKDIAELVFVTAPFDVPMPTDITEEERARLQRLYDSEGGELHPYAWWFAKGTPARYEGFEEAMRQIRSVLAEQGPFDGVLGFSQGAVFASLLASIYSRPDEPLRLDSRHPAFRFAILISGFPSRCPSHSYLYERPIQCPSLHMIGLGDTVVLPEGSEKLANTFENPTVYRHDGGHVIPTNAAGRNTLFEYIQQFHPQSNLHI
ncbi:ovarian cancer-associated gene 2 protein [Thamnocephalis sphaerospora]|uniref:Ovarian cancer-associated gene 2 protein n=1 Tax=Thamnocephalis sphaerospora TaxID=78915 RepID=A0A4P9XVW3_9FUNG|nr:ovarian cancer-associated gene 2 protein [Thamnocephalis sphaerospora]|eukprot:RKP10434.1 ovarian cancer-associated gene 2 protein [Thamnocephalis sphaerospora]